MSAPIRILLVEDHDIVREGLRSLIEAQEGCLVAAEAATGRQALALAAENAMLNNGRQVRFERGDALETLNELHRRGKTFDVVICDPPRLAPDRAAVPKALRKYRDLHLRAMRAVNPGGLLAVSSCSGAVQEEEFERTLREAAYDLKREAQILYRGGQAADHPVLATCPEGRYLKFLLACVA